MQNDEHEWGSQLGLTDAKVDRQQRHPHAINLQCILKKSSILLEANYDDQTVSRVSMNRILQQLERLLTLLNETSLTSTIQSLNVVSAADLKLIAEYNASIPPATEECVHRMIEERVRTEPNAAAVCAWDGILTYQELDERSTRLAKHIRTVYTLKPDDIILLLYEKSMWAVVSMYTTLKAGCAYAFLGIQDPVERHSQLIASTRSRLVLTSTALAGAMAFHEISHLTVDEELMHSLPAMESSFQSDVHPHNLAFLVFSSGSTGVPKAAMIEHMSAATSAIAHGTREGLNTASRVYQFASYSFDISTGDMLTTLIFGGCVCIPSEDQRLGDLAGSMKALGINRACLTPTVASLLKPEDVPGLKILKLGGEALTHANVAAWAGKVHLINGYGPCEASIWSSYRTDISIQTDPSNCGSAVGCALWIANPEDYNKLIPLGAIGELLIEGPTLARGYFNDVERTIGAFVQPAFLREMFPERPGRVYRTGDLFRYASDGTIRFVGRKDSQVKVHGQRIELKEIESHIVSVCAGDGLGAVVYPKYGPFKGKLVAVLSFGNGLAQNGYVHILSENDKGLARVKFHHLETELLAALPPYMVPRVWIAVEALPVNPSGKLHRAVLTKWTESLSNAQKQQIRDTMDLSAEQNGLQSQPLSGSERTIQKIWAKVLGIPESGINADSNYFVLGGDSLSAMQIASLCRSEGLNLTMKDILGCKTLAKLALSASATLESPIYDIAKETSDTSTTFHLSAANFERLRQLPLFFGDCDPKLAVDDAFPATPMQRGIFLSRLKVLQSYNISIYLRVTSPSSKDGVDLNRLAEAWRRVVQRQPSLRTVFVNDARIHSGLLQIVIGGILTQSRQHYVADETEALRLHRQTQPCWDSNEPEQSIAFYQLPTGDVVCALDIAHTLTDAWSTDIIISDLAAAYDGLLPTDPAPSLRRLTEYLTDERRSSSIVYWKKYLQDSNPCIFPDLDVQPANSSHVDVDVSFPGLDFREFCTRTQTTPAVLFQAICALTLRVYSGWDDVVFGLLSSGRDIPIPDAENTLGAFITMLVGRFRFDARTTIQAQVQRLQRDYVEHLSYQFFPLADLQHALGLAGQPLFDTVLSVLAEPSATHTPKSGLRFDRIDQDGLTEYALVVNVDQSQEMLSATFTADLRRISEAQLHSIANTFSHIAFEMVAKQELQLGDINTISEIDRQHIDSWNSQCPEPLELCVNTLLQDQMVKNPDAPAIFACDGQLSYNELGRRSAAVAAHLIKLGLRPGSFVPFCFEHSMYAIVCIVGIIRAGLAAVPLDPSHPLTRLRLISSQVEAKVLLCSRQQLERCKDLAIEVVAAVEDVLDGNSLCTSTIEQVAVQPSDPVYVIFTSGSTGTPKGVIWSHSNLSSSMLMHAEPLKFRERSRMLQFGAYVFDVSVSEILTTLVCGKCICIPSEDERLGHLEDFITRAQVDWAFLTPTVARLINPDNVPSLKTLLQGGEFVGQDNVAKWSSRLQLIITAGPSETTIYSTHRLVKDPASRADNLGYAVGGVHWLVDPSNPDRIVSIGEIGEILTEGPIVSQGYLRNPAATSAAFIAAPRWYRSKDKSNGVQPQFYLTGDLARLNATDGTLRIAGRKGMQVKVRGQRMELQEIEHVLNQHHLVDHVVVMLVTEGPFKNRLVGVFSAVASQGYCQSLLGLELCTETKHVSKATSSLEDWLTERLPRNMVPSTWLCLKTLPRTTNGKLDRVRLKHWLHDLNEEGSILISAACRQSVTEIHEPKTPKEWKLCKIWASVLNMDEGAIGTNQSFYRLGGDSISALKVMTESRKSGIKITVQDLLREKTVSRLATVAQDIESDDRQSSDLSLMQDNGPFELTAIQQLHVIRDPDLTCRTNQSVLVQLQDGIHRQTVIDALRTIMAKHHMLRAQFRRNDSGNWIQEIKSEEAYALRLDSISVGTTAELEAAILDCQKTISVAANINMAAGLFTMGSRYLLFVTASHMVVDLVSWRIILDDLEEYLIKQRIDHRTTSSYQQWSHKQALMAIEYAKSGQISKYDLHKPSDDDHKFWKFWSDSAIENNEADAINSRVTLSTHHTSLILGQANNAYDTAPVELIIAAVLHSFAMVFPEHGLPAMYFEGHGRQTTDPIIDLSRTVGWFTTMTPVRATFRQLDKLVRQIKDIRASTQDGGLAQFCHQILSTGREYIRLPFELLFNYAGMFQQLERADAVLREPQNLNAALQDLSMELPRFSLFAVEAGVSDGKLNMELIYNRHIRHQDRVLRWVETCLETLRTIAETFPHNLQKVSLYQFPRFSGSYDELDRLAQVALSHCGLSTLDSISDLSPASPMQEYMRAAESLRPGLLNSHFAFAIHGLDCQGDALRKTIDTAWQQVVNKHDILRTVFVNDPSKVHTTWQVVLKEFRTEVREATVIRDDCLQALMAEPPVPYCEGIPHHRLTLYHDPSGPAFCVLDISHALSDGGSKAPLFADLSSALGGSLGTSPGIGYAAASSQISQLHQMSYAFWEAYTRALEPCHLVPDNSATGFSHLQAGKAVPIPAEEKLKNLCANEGFTLGNLFMAAWTIMLAIYTDSTAVCFNYISAGRDQPVQEINSAIGPYFNMLISKAIVRDDMSLLDVINAAKDDFLDTLPHHGVSLPAVERHCSKNLTNLCNTTVNFRKFVSSDGNHIVNSNHGQIFVKELQTSAQPVHNMSLNAWDENGTLGVSVCYRPEAFTEKRAEDTSALLGSILRNMVESPEMRVATFKKRNAVFSL